MYLNQGGRESQIIVQKEGGNIYLVKHFAQVLEYMSHCQLKIQDMNQPLHELNTYIMCGRVRKRERNKQSYD